MKHVSAAQKITAETGAILRGIKVWLNAPVAFRWSSFKNDRKTAPLPGKVDAAALVLHVCWLSILLGLSIQISLLIVTAVLGRAPKLNPLIVDLAQRTAWSTIVCSGISVAMAASKLRESFMGLAGLLSASLAFKIASAIQKGVGAALGVAPAVTRGPSPLVLGIIKAIEYGCLAAMLAWMIKRKERGVVAHVAVGLTTGLLFGAVVLGYTYWTNVQLFSAADAVSRGLNEVLFPIGCSLVLFATDVWGKHWKSAGDQKIRTPLEDRATT